jgi:tripartite-type tricarboxylate transporter receptor subunit TctC
MKKTSMFLVVLLAFLLAAGSLGPFAQASDYPTKPITITCVWGAGGGTDVALRAFAKYLEKEIGQPIVVVNKPGGAGAIGYTEVARQRGDGYNLVQCTVDFAVMEALGTHAFSDKFRFIGLVNKYPMLIPVNAKAKWNTIKELIEDAKQRPGEITCGVTGAGNINHAAGLIFEKACGVKFNSLPFSQGDHESDLRFAGRISDFGLVQTWRTSRLPSAQAGCFCRFSVLQSPTTYMVICVFLSFTALHRGL